MYIILKSCPCVQRFLIWYKIFLQNLLLQGVPKFIYNTQNGHFPKYMFFFLNFFSSNFVESEDFCPYIIEQFSQKILGLIYWFEISKFSKKSYFSSNCRKKQSERHNVKNKRMQNEILNKSLLCNFTKKMLKKAKISIFETL